MPTPLYLYCEEHGEVSLMPVDTLSAGWTGRILELIDHKDLLIEAYLFNLFGHDSVYYTQKFFSEHPKCVMSVQDGNTLEIYPLPAAKRAKVTIEPEEGLLQQIREHFVGQMMDGDPGYDWYAALYSAIKYIDELIEKEDPKEENDGS